MRQYGCAVIGLLLFFNPTVHAHQNDCDISYEAYPLVQKQIHDVDEELLHSLKKRPGMKIKKVIWVGKEGIYRLVCPRRVSAVPLKPYKGAIDYSKINGWIRGKGTPSEPGSYIFQTEKTEIPVKVYSLTAKTLKKFNLKIAKKGNPIKIGMESVQAQYLYGPEYFKQWVMRSGETGGSRIERHPSPHLITLAQPPTDNKPSYLLVGKVDSNNNLELGFIEMVVGVPVIIPANTVHTNDYFRGLEESIYPRAWGVDEVIMVNKKGKRVILKPVK
ncbi:hypothetical protein [Legionella spiritensis]|uniref:Uncharacterized protein n=1 Tax=Legionella spiritensis TaxID=452 RepID=A0A0W0Z4N1_LEGSP|nr:hypothetical protein [Legionella spiritensis]KTD64106.1 hypothetical protein Lspi_1625 [Legionella spiritensis]SNV37847.1 Uncharacterised protein [Legionella spiritensis]